MVVEVLPTLIHLSVSLFFAGLVVFLWHVNLTIFKAVLSWISVCTILYGCITLICQDLAGPRCARHERVAVKAKVQ